MSLGTKATDFSILIARASTEDSERILEVLDALGHQEGDFTYQTIVADRCNDAISAWISEAYPDIHVLICPPETGIPKMRTLALQQANGKYVVITEDHCLPPSDWLASIERTFRKAPEETVAVGGCVENGVVERTLDWATFFCEYSHFLMPINEGKTDQLPGMNVAYLRSALEQFAYERLVEGFWETTVHPLLCLGQQCFIASNDIVVLHCKRFSFGFFVRQRFIYSRYYAGQRFSHRQFIQRVAAAVGSFALPGLLVYRWIRDIQIKKRLYMEFCRALPILIVLAVIWAAGEIAGYVLGPGDALAKIE